MKLTKTNYINVFSYETQKGVRWMFRYPFHDSFGKRHEKQERGFTTPEAAHKAELTAEMKVSEDEADQLLDSGMTIRQWTTQFLKMNEAEWRPNYRRNFATAVKNYILPLLGDRKLGKLTKMEYNYLFIQPQLEHLKPSSVQANHRMFMVIMNAAEENEIIPRNRLKGIRFKKSERRKPFSEEDLALFNKQLRLEETPTRLFFQLLETTGMRLSEGLGLEWRDINFTKRTLSIQRTRTPDGFGPTKTPSSVRTISIDEAMILSLHRFMTAAKAEGLKSGTGFSQRNVLFEFNHVSAYYHFQKVIKSAGIEPGRYVIHSLRHTHATILMGAGVSPVDVAARLGHSDPAITLRIYAHAIKGNDQKNAELFAKIVNL
ncbi:tyrosine-type recombinase/integrase [Levilactobacillus senmaizukei]|uniref:tyrosine-type recombinase/integrase n=1 Tax=Levilactobacillus senmaizukei TaxID=431273 RepID=UPI00077BDAC5|nr:tyrosine-type recombinase/integrase [Levilactobacillus senmaizukei]